MYRSVSPIFDLIQAGLRFLAQKLSFTDKPRCKNCKEQMQPEASYLYLLPSYLDDAHVEDLDYYLKNAVPIAELTDIPSGRRACYFNVFRCPACARREVSLIDFLHVRGETLVKGAEECPYEKVQPFFMETQMK